MLSSISPNSVTLLCAWAATLANAIAPAMARFRHFINQFSVMRLMSLFKASAVIPVSE
jgi:hypothetical protein